MTERASVNTSKMGRWNGLLFFKIREHSRELSRFPLQLVLRRGIVFLLIFVHYQNKFKEAIHLAWETSPLLATLRLVSPTNDVWETSAEIPYWWRITTQIWVVLLIGCYFASQHYLIYLCEVNKGCCFCCCSFPFISERGLEALGTFCERNRENWNGSNTVRTNRADRVFYPTFSCKRSLRGTWRSGKEHNNGDFGAISETERKSLK